MSPGHGKTLVGAYLIGERATPLHAVFLAMTTTITHTLGVFALGFRDAVRGPLYTTGTALSLAELGIGKHGGCDWAEFVVAAVEAMAKPLRRRQAQHLAIMHNHGHHHHGHHHHYSHHHGHHHDHDNSHHHSHDEHSHGNHTHSHLPAAAGEAVTWRSLLLLGLSAGLVPCPAALVLLLGAIAIGNPFSGLVLVFVFSLGLSVVLTALGLDTGLRKANV